MTLLTAAAASTSTGAVVNGIMGAIGNTPLIRLSKLSRQTGCEILGKVCQPGSVISMEEAIVIAGFHLPFRSSLTLHSDCVM